MYNQKGYAQRVAISQLSMENLSSDYGLYLGLIPVMNVCFSFQDLQTLIKLKYGA